QMQKSGFRMRVFPACRPDRAVRIDDPVTFNEWVRRLGECAAMEVKTFADFLGALRKRHDDFHQLGCRLSDHGLDACPMDECDDAEGEAIFKKLYSGSPVSAAESSRWAGYLMLFFGQLDAEKGWTNQLHVGAFRNANTRAMASIGRDTGFDSIGDWPQAQGLLRYLDQLEQRRQLPKMIL